MAWSKEQLRNARIIAQVGRQLGMSSRDIQIGLMAALQESGLRNLNYGDRDSLGIFQQRPSAGWGSRSQVTDPFYASRRFFQALGRIGNRNNIEMWRAAQRVQVSAYPRAYAKWADDAQGLLGKIGQPIGMPQDIEPELDMSQGDPLAGAMDKILDDGLAAPTSSPGESPTTPGLGTADIDWSDWQPDDLDVMKAQGEAQELMGELDLGSKGDVTGIRSGIVQMAKRKIGTPYVFGATGPNSFDCSSFVQWAFRQMGVKLPRLAYQQARSGQLTSLKDIQAGDLVFWGNRNRTSDNHIALYLGNGQIIEAPKPGYSVRIRKLRKGEKAMGIRMKY